MLEALEKLEDLEFGMKKAKTAAEIDAVRAQLRKVILGMEAPTKQWTEKELRSIYAEAFKATGGEKIPKAVLDRNKAFRRRQRESLRRSRADLLRWADDRAVNNRIGKAYEIYNNQLFEAKRAFSRTGSDSAAAKVAELEKKIKDLPPFNSSTPTPTVYYRRNGKIVARYPAQQYYEMVERSARQTMINLGVVEGAPADSWFIVSDGPDCGWTSHEDSDKANGQVVPQAKARAHPLAHPNCQRQFEMADGPPRSKKLNEQLRKLFGTANKRQIQRAAKVGAVLKTTTTLYRLGKDVATSAIARRTLAAISREVPGLLPKWAERSISKWEKGWGRRESLFVRAKSVTASDSIDFDDFIRASIVAEIGTPDFVALPSSAVVQIPREYQDLLGLSGRTHTKREVVERIEEYGDYVAHREAASRNQLQNLVSNRLSVEAQDEIYQYAALKIPLNAPRGWGAFQQVTDAYKVAKRVWTAEPGRASVELIRDVAGRLDFLPWPSTSVGPFRFSVGLSAEGRRDLAEKLFVKFRSQVDFKMLKYGQNELTWAKNLGLDLGQRNVTMDDVWRGLLPRLTGWPGKAVNFTLGIEDGKLTPLFRFYPPGALGRIFDFRYRLRTEEVGQYINHLTNEYRVARYGDPRVSRQILNFLKSIDDSSAFTIDVFRGSPIRASARLYGRHLDSFAIHTGAELSWAEQAWRLYGRDLFQGETYRREFRKLINRGLSPQQAVEVLRRSDLPAKYMRVTAPRINGTNFFNGDDVDVLPALLRLYAWHGNTLEAARSGGISWDSFMKIFHTYKQDFVDTRSRFIEAGGSRVRSLRDIEVVRNTMNAAQRNTRASKALADSIADEAASPAFRYTNRLTISDEVWDYARLDNSSDSLRVFQKDVDSFYRAWTRMTGQPPPSILVDATMAGVRGVEAEDVMGATFNRGNTIVVDPNLAIRWTKDSTTLTRKLAADGYFINGEVSHVLWHESGHYLANLMSTEMHERMWAVVVRELLEELGFEGERLPSLDTIISALRKPGVYDVPRTLRVRTGPMNTGRRAMEVLGKAFKEDMDFPDLDSAVGQVQDTLRWISSQYGSTDPNEFLAEAFADYAMNPNPSKYATIIGSFLTGRRTR
jgi:hypothetical protein